jgi:hypothetical protein
MANEVHLTSEFIYRRLAADAPLVALISSTDPVTHVVTIRVYHEFGGSAAAYPHVLILFRAATDVNTVGAGGRIFTRPLFLVEAVTQENSWLGAQAIADRLEVALMGVGGIQGPVNIGPLYGEAPMRRLEITPEGQRLNHLGRSWRTLVSSLP